MPIYEFRCLDCWARATVFFQPPRPPEPRCAECGSTRIVRLMGRFVTTRSATEPQERMTDTGRPAGPNGSDRRARPRWMRRMGRKRGAEMDGEKEPEDGGQAG